MSARSSRRCRPTPGSSGTTPGKSLNAASSKPSCAPWIRRGSYRSRRLCAHSRRVRAGCIRLLRTWSKSSPTSPILDFKPIKLYDVATLGTTGGHVKFTNVRELKAKTSEMLRTVEMGNPVLVTNHGRPTAMLVPVTEDDIEDAMLAYSPQLRKKIEAGLKDIRAGRTMPLAEYMNRRAKRKAKRA